VLLGPLGMSSTRAFLAKELIYSVVSLIVSLIRPAGQEAPRRQVRQMSTDDITLLLQHLKRIEAALCELLSQRTAKDWYTTDEVADILGKAKFTVREWCQHGRVYCRKQNTGRGMYQSWVISHEELRRIQRDGLLPLGERRQQSPES
jgi:hypothetical protein